MSKRTASTFAPDSDIEGVAPEDVRDNCIENRHIADNEVDGAKVEQIADGAGVPVILTLNITTGSASEKLFDANLPYKIEILEVIVQPRGASTNGTMKVTNGTNDITDAMVTAVDKTMVRSTTIDDAYSTIAAGGTVEVVCAGDTIGNTKGLVTIIARKVD